MGVLQNFERRLAGFVEGAFAKVFKGSVEPVEIAKALTGEADSQRVVSANRTLVPNTYLVELGPRDHERLAQYSEPLGAELASMVREHATVQRYAFVGPVTVTFGLDPALDTGVFRVRAEVSPDGAYTPKQPIDVPAPPVPAQAPPPPAADAPDPADAPLAPDGPFAAGAPLPVDEPSPDLTRPEPTPARPASAPPARLLFDDGRAFDLVAAVVRIGRSREADLRLDDTAVSRHHAELRRDTDGSYLLVDLGSTNGTMVNGERTATAHLRDGDRVGVGAATLTYRARAGLG